MKKILTAVFLGIVLAAGLAACSSGAKADYESPKALIEANEAINTDHQNNSIYRDLEGKTFRITADITLDKSEIVGDVETAKEKNEDIWVRPYSDIGIDVFVGVPYDQWEDFSFKKGDVMVLKLDYISLRGSANGKIKQYYIYAHLAE